VILSTDLAELFCRDCIARQPGPEFAFWSGLALAGTLFCLWRARTSLARARLIADLPTSRVRSASQGLVELAGFARTAGEALVAPLSGRPCLWWRYRIERHRSTRHGSSWTTVERGASEAPLALDDGSGHCLILPDGGEVHSHRVKRWTGHRRQPLGDGSGDHGLLGAVFGQRYRYTEEIIVAGDPLYVVGHFETDDQGLTALLKSPVLSFLSTLTTGSPTLAYLLAEKIPVEQLPIVIGKLQMAYELFNLLSADNPQAREFDLLALWPLLLENQGTPDRNAWAFGHGLTEYFTQSLTIEQLRQRFLAYLQQSPRAIPHTLIS